MYLESLIKQETLRALGPVGRSKTISSSETSDSQEVDVEQQKLLQGIGKQTVEVLKMILRRLKAQRATTGREDIQLLAALLRENDPNVHFPSFPSLPTMISSIPSISLY